MWRKYLLLFTCKFTQRHSIKFTCSLTGLYEGLIWNVSLDKIEHSDILPNMRYARYCSNESFPKPSLLIQADIIHFNSGLFYGLCLWVRASQAYDHLPELNRICGTECFGIFASNIPYRLHEFYASWFRQVLVLVFVYTIPALRGAENPGKPPTIWQGLGTGLFFVFSQGQ